MIIQYLTGDMITVQMRRVVVTGMGMISPVGGTLEESWKNILAGKSGISKIDHFDTTDFPVKIAGLVKNFEPEKWGNFYQRSA